MKAKIFILPKKGTLHPPDKVVLTALHGLGVKIAENLSLGRYIEIDIPQIGDQAKWLQKVNEACKKRAEICNPIIEEWRIEFSD